MKWIKRLFIGLLLIIILIRINIGINEPSEKSCLNEKILLQDGLNIDLRNFREDEMHSVIVKHLRNGKILETWTVNPYSLDNEGDTGMHIKQTFYVDDIYEFHIKGKKPYILKDMKNIFLANHEFGGSNECHGDRYWINGNYDDGIVIPYGK